MSATIAALLVGTAAVGGFGAWAGSSSSTTIPTKEEALEEVAKVVEQEDEPSQPTPESKPITPPPTPIVEPVPEPLSEAVPTEETKEEKVAEPVPETTNMEGGSKQDGGFGKPTWAPLNSGDSLQSAIGITKDQIGSTGSSLIAKWTGAKTAESIQLKLKEIDDQLRVLKVQKFNTESDIVSKSTGLEQIRTEYLKALTNKTKFEKFGIYYDRELSKLLDPKPAGSDGSLKSIVENKFPKKKDGNLVYPNKDKPSETDFKLWSTAAYEHFKTLLSDEPEGIKPKEGENKDAWWARIGKETSSSANKEPRDIEVKLTELLEKKTKNTTLLEQAIQDEQEQKPFYDESIQKLKDLRLKLQNTLKKIKELLDTRELVLVELSNYELPKGMFETFIKQKPIQKPLLLPTGQERDKIFAEIKDLEKQLKNIEEQINDEIDLQLNKNPNWKPKDDKSDEYSKLVNKQIELKDQRDNKILELEGRISKEVKEIPELKNKIPIERKRYLENICPKIIKDLNIKIKALKITLKEKETTYSEISELKERITQLEEINKDNLRRTNPTPQIKQKMEKHKKEEQDKKTRLAFLTQKQPENTPEIIADLKQQISELETKVKNLKSDCLKYAEIYSKEIQETAVAAAAEQARVAEERELLYPRPLTQQEIETQVKAKTQQRLVAAAEEAPPAALAEAPPPAEAPIVKSVFKFDDDFTYEGKNYKVREINESDVEGDTTKMKVIDRDKKIYNVELDGKGKTLTFSETDQKVKNGGKNHLTRKQQWTRSKPSRFKTHRIY